MRRVIAVLALAAIVATIWVLPVSADDDSETRTLRRFHDAKKVKGATATLVRTDDGIRYTVKSRKLPAGDTVTLWVVIFNDPDECSGDCGEDDLSDPDAEVSVNYGGGGLVGSNGRIRIEGFIQEDDNSHAVRIPGFLLDPPPAMDDPDDVEVHLVVRSHGPVIEDLLFEQTHTFRGGCDEGPPLGEPGPNECLDLQFAVFEE